MDFLSELAKFGGVAGVVAAIFYQMLMKEQARHEATRAALVQSLIDRLNDSKEDAANYAKLSNSVSDNLRILTTKIDSGSSKVS